MIDLPTFEIGDNKKDQKVLRFNLIQGGMGVGISGRNLASAVADCGGAGIIASVGLGLLKDYPVSYSEANQIALREEIRAARKMSNGVIGVNIMHALTDYPTLVETAVEENVDLIISGAGIPKDLPKLVGDKDIKLVPIVSSARLAGTMCKGWKRYNHLPDAIIVEGPKAGGHLAFNEEQLGDPEFVENALEDIVRETVNVVEQFGDIPIIAAGGIYTGEDIRKALSWGATGVQMATRFVTTDECDAADNFKQAYINTEEDGIGIIKSPVGMLGRAITNSFLKTVIDGEKIHFNCKYQCLKTCDPQESLYCIADALTLAQQGIGGFAFAGSNAYKATEFITVQTLMQRLSDEYHS